MTEERFALAELLEKGDRAAIPAVSGSLQES